MAPRMSAARKLFQDSPVSFKQQPKNEMARSSTPYRICSSRKAKKLLSKPTLHRAKLNETDASRLSTTPRTMEQVHDEVLANDRFTVIRFASFAVVALSLTAVGIYGVTAFSVNQRSHEFALRMALGARNRVVALIVKEGFALACAGL